jgi:serine/threonine protein kinase
MSKTITINNIFWTDGAKSQQVSKLEISDDCVYKGGFGRLHDCISLDGAPPATAQLIKILEDNSPGLSKAVYSTIIDLQREINSLFKRAPNSGYDNVFQVPALKAFPLFSFEGNLNGDIVMGYSAVNLVPLGFTLYEDIIDNAGRKQQYMSLPFQQRFRFCFHLAKGFEILDRIKYVHADINPKNFFINLATGELAIIDFDGGAVLNRSGAKPRAFGKIVDGDWLSPELYQQLADHKDPIASPHDDLWAVSVAFHFLIFGEAPFFFLSEGSAKCKEEYLSNNRLHPINKHDNNIKEGAEYDIFYYEDVINAFVPQAIHQQLTQTFEQGFFLPQKRTAYSHWMELFRQTQPAPAIQAFNPHKNPILKGAEVVLEWRITGDDVYKVTFKGIGDVTGTNRLTIRPSQSTTYQLDVTGHFGQAQAYVDVTVFPVTLLESLKVPFPATSIHTNLDGISVSSPKLTFVRLNVENLRTPPIPFAKLDEKIREVKPFNIKKSDFFSITRVFNEIKGKTVMKLFEHAKELSNIL